MVEGFVSAGAPKPAPEGACAPQNVAAPAVRLQANKERLSSPPSVKLSGLGNRRALTHLCVLLSQGVRSLCKFSLCPRLLAFDYDYEDDDEDDSIVDARRSVISQATFDEVEGLARKERYLPEGRSQAGDCLG
jgi:hypothetical protein